jgi:hypothetical protein
MVVGSALKDEITGVPLHWAPAVDADAEGSASVTTGAWVGKGV